MNDSSYGKMISDISAVQIGDKDILTNIIILKENGRLVTERSD